MKCGKGRDLHKDRMESLINLVRKVFSWYFSFIEVRGVERDEEQLFSQFEKRRW